MTNSLRASARMARDRIVQANPEDLTLIERTSSHPHSLTHLPPFLQLWSLCLSSLSHIRLFNQALAEATNVFGALATIEPPSARTHVVEHVLPFELDVIHTLVKYWAGDALAAPPCSSVGVDATRRAHVSIRIVRCGLSVRGACRADCHLALYGDQRFSSLPPFLCPK